MASPDSNVVISAFTEEQVERLTGITRRQLRWWDAQEFFVPAIAHEDRSKPYSRLYAFGDLVALKVLNALRNECKVPLKELKRVKETLSHMGEAVWTKTTLYVHDKKVAFVNPETGVTEEIVSGQGVLQIALQVVVSNMRKAVDDMRERGPEIVGQITKRRGLLNSMPVVAGTRIPIRSIKAFANSGYSEEDILKEYPTLKVEDVRAAIKYPSAA
jgi:uncharacterized protein (DUF433 family)